VELFFKWIKQHLRIKQFYGTSENAVKTQIWIAVSQAMSEGNRNRAARLNGFGMPAGHPGGRCSISRYLSIQRHRSNGNILRHSRATVVRARR
jgi:hypothetical protein